jgi:hypothetical protein
MYLNHNARATNQTTAAQSSATILLATKNQTTATAIEFQLTRQVSTAYDRESAPARFNHSTLAASLSISQIAYPGRL